MSVAWSGGHRSSAALSYVGGDGNLRGVVEPKRKTSRAQSFPAEKKRYQLFGSHGCALCQQALIVRRLRRLERVVDFVDVRPELGIGGWQFGKPGEEGRTIQRLLYDKSRQACQSRPLLPLLWDKKRKLVVCNDLAHIVQSLDEGFAGFGRRAPALRPPDRKRRVDELTAFINANLVRNLYVIAFGEVEDELVSAHRAVHTALGMFEHQLTERPYVLGGQLTLADWSLASALARLPLVAREGYRWDLSQYPVTSAFDRRMRREKVFKQTFLHGHAVRTFRYSALSKAAPKQDESANWPLSVRLAKALSFGRFTAIRSNQDQRGP